MATMRKLIAAIEPWYDWGIGSVLRVDGRGEGDGRWFSVDFLGLHATIIFGRTPPITKEA